MTALARIRDRLSRRLIASLANGLVWFVFVHSLGAGVLAALAFSFVGFASAAVLLGDAL